MSKKSPQLRFEGFTDDWEERKLSDIADRFDNLRVPITASDRKPGDTPYYGANGIQDYVEGFTHNGEFILVAEDGANDLKNYPVQYVNGKAWVNHHAHVLQGKKTITDNKFLMNAIKNFNIEPFLVGGGRAKLNADVMMKLNILLPTFVEQEKIGSLFSLLDKTIALHQRKLDLLKEQKKGYLQKMFPKNGAKVPELRFAGFADDWEERKLGDVGDTFTGLTGKTKEDFGHGSAKFVTYVNVFQNPIATLDQLDAVEIDEKQNQVQKGDVFFTTSSETPEEVGMSSVWTYDTKNVYLNSFTFGYRPRVSFDLNYMASMLRSPSIRKKITLLAQGISRYNISKTKMLEIEIPAPNLSEQTKIGLFFKGLDDTIALHQRKLDLLKEQKKGFLQKMFV